MKEHADILAEISHLDLRCVRKMGHKLFEHVLERKARRFKSNKREKSACFQFAESKSIGGSHLGVAENTRIFHNIRVPELHGQ